MLVSHHNQVIETLQSDRAQTVHGSYRIWDLGDRPEALMAEAPRLLAETPKIELVDVLAANRPAG